MSLLAIGIVSAINDCVTLFQWAKSAISSINSKWSGSQEQSLQDSVLKLESGLQLLKDTLPAMYDLINKAEWRSHEHYVAKLLPSLKDAVSEADDLIDEFRWYEMKLQVEGNASQSPFIDFLDTIIQGSFNKLNDVQLRLNHLSSQLDNMGLRGVTPHFDKLVRPETTSMPNEAKLFGRNNEMKQVLGLLKVPTNLRRRLMAISENPSTSASARNQVSKSRILSLPVLPIVGIGGVGKTTLAQHICSNKRVESYFEPIIWICVSDDFDVKRLTKEAIQSCTEKEVTSDNLDCLQRALFNHVKDKRLLVVLDDIWDDALKENGQCWKRFCAPFRSVQEGSAMLVTTRCSKVTEVVRTLEPFILEGLKDDIFWNFFKSYVFGSQSSENYPELECIGRRILPKLKGSPLAAKTLGRMLSMDLQESHWNFILESELWQLKQKETEILPALRLSYMYLPFYLKQCFRFCAVYPKDYIFQKQHLAEIWVAEGFVEPQGGVPIQDIGCQYFEDLVARSFFGKVSGGYVIHDLLHDMAQQVSEHDCFILRNESDFDKVPQNVRHLYVLPSSDFDDSSLLRLCKYTKLRTLICKKDLEGKTSFIMDQWCTKLLCMRVISCPFTNEFPDSIGNWKHLRYLKIYRSCPLKRIPLTLCWLYYLTFFYVGECILESLPNDFGKLVNLQSFSSHGFSYYAGLCMRLDAEAEGREIRLMKNLNQFRGHLEIYNVGSLSNDHTVEVELKNKMYLDELKLRMHSFVGSPESQSIHHKEVLEILQPHISLKSLILENYHGVSLPSWFQPQNMPSLKSLSFVDCSSAMISQSISVNGTPAVGIFLSLANVTISGCSNMLGVLHPDYVPAIRKIRIESCQMLESLPIEEFGELNFLEELDVCNCPNIRLQRLFLPSLKKLQLSSAGLLCNIDCCSLTNFVFGCDFVTSIQLQVWNLPALQKLQIQSKSLTSIGDSITSLSSLNVLLVALCDSLSTLDGLLTQELPAIQKIDIYSCPKLVSLPVERFVSFPYLKHLKVWDCESLNWQMGLVLPSSLQSLSLQKCGDTSPCVPSCLENLTSLVSLRISGCKSITSIPSNIWRTTLASLEELNIEDFPNLVSIGGRKAIAKIKKVTIYSCPKLKEVKMIRGCYVRYR
ncbi:putative disease resistance protein RGA4 [Triticum dicoccoides]|uniref:putative disease resistance protein RGA4 n=1 Tax=Triticum dicoccoides TaxID=85692 RepID=UPI000E7B9946|nr:putative disease resistance protein RGA4 [Triticum dicoccoides]XP_037480242.1 putative disease resistance protein RGA4 [Triticum dicoccoides]